MTDKLYEKYQQPKFRFTVDWIWRILCLAGVAFVSYATLWGDHRYVTKDQLGMEIEQSVRTVLNESVKPRLQAVEALATSDARHPTPQDLAAEYVTRREFNLIVSLLTEIRNEVKNQNKGNL